MDGGPFRSSQPTERRAAPRPETAPAPRPVETQQRAVHRSSPAHHEMQSSRSRWRIPLIVVVLIIVLSAIGGGIWAYTRSTAVSAVDTNVYQAVSVTDGQVYFGKVTFLPHNFVKISNAYYLQAQTDDKSTGATDSTAKDASQQNMKLIKLGNKLYGPGSDIVIPGDKVLSYEALNPDGQVGKWLKDNDSK